MTWLFADTMAEATARLDEQRFDMIFIGTQLDESRMFDLLRYLQSIGKPHGNTAIVYFRGMIAVPPVSEKGISLGCTVIRRLGFLRFCGLS